MNCPICNRMNIQPGKQGICWIMGDFYMRIVTKHGGGGGGGSENPVDNICEDCAAILLASSENIALRFTVQTRLVRLQQGEV